MTIKNNLLFLFPVILLLLMWSAPLFAQTTDSTFVLYRNIPLQASYLTTDKLQQFYVITDQNELVKYNPAGVEVFRYSNNKLGALTSVDVSNPFNLLLFYSEYATVITLDRTLSLTGSFNVTDLGIPQTEAVGLASDNHIWVYDEMNYHLRKYDGEGKILIESQDLSAMLPQMIHPVMVLEKNNRVYLQDPETGILVFDIFGQYLHTLPLTHLQSMQLSDGFLLFLQEGQFFAWQLEAGIKRPVATPVRLSEEGQLRLEKNCFYILDKNGVRLFRKRGT